MEAFYTDSPSKKKAPQPSTVRVSLGRRCEAFAAKHLEAKGWKVLATNIRFKAGEVDLLAYDPHRFRHVVVEVRGRSVRHYRSANTLSFTKTKRLKTLTQIIQQRKKTPVHLLFIEVILTKGRFQLTEFPIENY